MLGRSGLLVLGLLACCGCDAGGHGEGSSQGTWGSAARHANLVALAASANFALQRERGLEELLGAAHADTLIWTYAAGRNGRLMFDARDTTASEPLCHAELPVRAHTLGQIWITLHLRSAPLGVFVREQGDGGERPRPGAADSARTVVDRDFDSYLWHDDPGDWRLSLQLVGGKRPGTEPSVRPGDGVRFGHEFGGVPEELALPGADTSIRLTCVPTGPLAVPSIHRVRQVVIEGLPRGAFAATNQHPVRLMDVTWDAQRAGGRVRWSFRAWFEDDV